MTIRVCEKSAAAGAAAAETAELLRRAIAQNGRARLMVGSEPVLDGALAALAAEPGVTWAEVEVFHAGEFVGLPIEHPGSCRRRLVDRLIQRARPGRYHLLDGGFDPEGVCRAEGEQLRAASVDVALLALGENGSLAFNEPPADFAIEKPYLLMRLDEGRRQREARAGRFATAAEVPDRAISLSLRQLAQAKAIVCLASALARADIVQRCSEGPASPLVPGSVLCGHPAAILLVEREAGSR